MNGYNFTEGEGVPAAVLQNLDADPNAMRAAVERTVKRGGRNTFSGRESPRRC